MPTTRHNITGDFKPEHGLSAAKIKGINIGLNIVCRVARAHPVPVRRAMIWLVNYAKLRGLTADALCEEIGLEKADINAALTDPDFDGINRFVEKVKARKNWFESTQIPKLVETKVVTIVGQACRMALLDRVMAEIVGKTRMGKSESARIHWLRNLDRCVWVETPSDETERTFIIAIAAALGIGISTAKKAAQYRPQIFACVGSGLIECFIFDECHRLWPSDPRVKPKRIEFQRELYMDGRGASIVNIATPQFTESLNASMEKSARWAPGQYEGRVIRFHLQDTMSDRDLRAVASHYAPEATAEVLDQLVAQAKSTDGFCGAMINAIKLARYVYLPTPDAPLTREAIVQAQAQMAKNTRIAALAAVTKPLRRTR